MILWYLTDIALAAEQQASGFTLTEIWQHSGWIARGVILMLIGMMLWSTYTGIDRILAFRRARAQSMALAAEIVGPLRRGDVAAARKLAADDRFKSSYLAGMLKAGLTELEARFDRFGMSNAHRAIEKATNEELSKLKRGMPILATTGSTAPFVGLFGTTMGVVNAFQGMSAGGAGLASVSAGISEALITTGVGIFVAVIGVWMYNYFTQRTEKVAEELASSIADFEDWAEKLMAEREQAREAGK